MSFHIRCHVRPYLWIDRSWLLWARNDRAIRLNWRRFWVGFFLGIKHFGFESFKFSKLIVAIFDFITISLLINSANYDNLLITWRIQLLRAIVKFSRRFWLHSQCIICSTFCIVICCLFFNLLFKFCKLLALRATIFILICDHSLCVFFRDVPWRWKIIFAIVKLVTFVGLYLVCLVSCLYDCLHRIVIFCLLGT